MYNAPTRRLGDERSFWCIKDYKNNNFLLKMIAGIDHQADIVLYLEVEEVDKLGSEMLKGVLIKTQKPKRQGIIHISVNDDRKNEKGFGIGINDEKYGGVQEGFCRCLWEQNITKNSESEEE